jgi:hypothetical protein
MHGQQHIKRCLLCLLQNEIYIERDWLPFLKHPENFVGGITSPRKKKSQISKLAI